jgi:hypothetical protein
MYDYMNNLLLSYYGLIKHELISKGLELYSLLK